jgi:DNA-binding NarL/FixJ family response regulator
MPNKTSVILFSHHPQITDRICSILKDSAFEVAGVTDSQQTASQFLNQLAPELLILSLDESCIRVNDIIYRLKMTSPRTKILLLQNQCSSRNVIDAIRTGASVFLPDDLELDGLVQILETVIAEEIYLPAFVAQSLLQAAREDLNTATEFPFRLTNREKVILKGLSEGRTLSELSQDLEISGEMLKAHASNILQKIHFVDIAKKQYQEIMSDFEISNQLRF